MKLGTAFVEIRGDASKLSSDLKTVRADVEKSTTNMSRSLNGVTKTVSQQQTAWTAQRESLLRNVGSMDELHKQALKTNRSFDGLGNATKNNTKNFAQLTAGILKSAPAFAVATAAIAGIYTSIRVLRDTITGGLGAVEDFRLKTASMAAFITTFADKSQEGGDIGRIYQRAKIQAEGLVETLEILDSRTIATGKDLTIIAEQFIKGGIFINLQNEKTKQGFINIANAVKLLTAGQNQEIQLRQEIRALSEGQLKDTNILVKTLQSIDPHIKEHLKTWKQQGNTIQKVGDLLKAFNFSADDLENTWSAIGTSLTTIKDRVLRGGMEPAYIDLLKWANELKLVYVDQNGELTEQAKILQDDIRGGWESIKDHVSSVSHIFTNFNGLIGDTVKLLIGLKAAQIAFNIAAKANPYLAIPMAAIGLAPWAERMGKALALAKAGVISYKDIVTSNDVELNKLIQHGDKVLAGGAARIAFLKTQIGKLKVEKFDIFDGETDEIVAKIKEYQKELKTLQSLQESMATAPVSTEPLTSVQTTAIQGIRELNNKLKEQLYPLDAIKKKWAEAREQMEEWYKAQKNSDKNFRVSQKEYQETIRNINLQEQKDIDALTDKTETATKRFEEFKKKLEDVGTDSTIRKFANLRSELQEIISTLNGKISGSAVQEVSGLIDKKEADEKFNIASKAWDKIKNKIDKNTYSASQYKNEIEKINANYEQQKKEVEEIYSANQKNGKMTEDDLKRELDLLKMQKDKRLEILDIKSRMSIKEDFAKLMKPEEKAIADVNNQYDKLFEQIKSDVANTQYAEDKKVSIIEDASKKIAKARKKALEELKPEFKFLSEVTKSFQDMFADFIFDPFSKGLKGMLVDFGNMIRKMIAQAVAADLTHRLFPKYTPGYTSSGVGEGLASLISAGLRIATAFFSGPELSGSTASAYSSAAGITPEVVGPVASQSFSGTMSSYSQTGNFASYDIGTNYVPYDMIAQIHKGEKIIPANQNNGSNMNGGVTINVTVPAGSPAETRRSAGQGAREALRYMNGFNRYS